MAVDRDEIAIRAAAVLTTSFVASSMVALRDIGYREIDYLVKVDAAGTLGSVEAVVQYSLQSNPSVWINLSTEAVTAGVSTLTTYTITAASPTTGDLIGFTVPTRGQFQRLMIRGTGTVTASSVSAYALRRG